MVREKKADHGSLEKAGPKPKFTVLSRNSFLATSSVLISNMTIFSKIHLKITPKRYFWIQLHNFSLLLEFLRLVEVDGADFKCSFFKFLYKNTQTRHF